MMIALAIAIVGAGLVGFHIGVLVTQRAFADTVERRLRDVRDRYGK